MGIFPLKLLLNEDLCVLLAFGQYLNVVVVFIKHNFWTVVIWHKGWINIGLNISAAWGWMRMAGSPRKVAKGHHVHDLNFISCRKTCFLLCIFHLNTNYSVWQWSDCAFCSLFQAPPPTMHTHMHIFLKMWRQGCVYERERMCLCVCGRYLVLEEPVEWDRTG